MGLSKEKVVLLSMCERLKGTILKLRKAMEVLKVAKCVSSQTLKALFFYYYNFLYGPRGVKCV